MINQQKVKFGCHQKQALSAVTLQSKWFLTDIIYSKGISNLGFSHNVNTSI